MKLSVLPFALLVFLSPLLFFSQTFAQDSTASAPQPATTSNNEVWGEGDDHLPFMQQERERAPEPSTFGLIFRTFGAMLIIVGLIFFGAWGMKKFNLVNLGARSNIESPELSVLKTVSIGSNRTLAVVRFSNRNLLIGSTAQTFTLLADESVPESQNELNFSSSSQSVSDLLAAQYSSF